MAHRRPSVGVADYGGIVARIGDIFWTVISEGGRESVWRDIFIQMLTDLTIVCLVVVVACAIAGLLGGYGWPMNPL